MPGLADTHTVVVSKSGAILTYSGVMIDPLNPDPECIMLEDIAHSLSNQCRFTGHTRYFYSVAQHSLAVSHLVPAYWALWGLLHDATEAYLADMARPIKHQPGFGEVYRAAEGALMQAVITRFGLDDNEGLPKVVGEADELMLANEIRTLMPDHEIYNDWKLYPSVPESLLRFTDPHDAKWDFIERFKELGGAYAGT